MGNVYPAKKVVNVSVVPHRSPFRYPGGKTWLVPRIRQWLSDLSSVPAIFVEPFAGGGIVSLTVAFEDLAQHVVMVEIDEEVAAVWTTLLDAGEAEWLANRITDFECTQDEVNDLLGKIPTSTKDQAFLTIVRNRVNHGGILAPGAGMIRTGDNGNGIASRWYATTLCQRIKQIEHIQEKITFQCKDGIDAIKDYSCREDVVFFVDPPYTASGKSAGSRLYAHSELDHASLFRLMSNVEGDFLMTYDNADEIRELAREHGFDTEPIAMKNTHHSKMTELLIGRSLDWLRTKQHRE